MIDQINHRIAAIEAELNDLRRQKLAVLYQQVEAVAASLAGGPPTLSDGQFRGDLSSKGWASEFEFAAQFPLSPANLPPRNAGPKKRGRRPGAHIPDEALLPSITSLVTSSGMEGISARQVSGATGIFYPRVLRLMEANFRKTGERKWSRYHLR